MSFTPVESPTSGKVEHQFTVDNPDNFAFMVVVLEDGTRLFVSSRPYRTWPSPWPLWYEPYVIEDLQSILWLDGRHQVLIDTLPDQQVAEYRNTRGLGDYVAIGGLELGKFPYMIHKFVHDDRAGRVTEVNFYFGSSVARFVPVSSREEAQALTPL